MKLKPNRPVETARPMIEIDGLPVGTHRVSLVVVNQSNHRSRPAIATVIVERLSTPHNLPAKVEVT